MGNRSSGELGIFGFLGILFICLKLVNAIDWPWSIVLLPLWGPVAFGFVVVALFVIFAVLLAVFKKS